MARGCSLQEFVWGASALARCPFEVPRRGYVGMSRTAVPVLIATCVLAGLAALSFVSRPLVPSARSINAAKSIAPKLIHSTFAVTSVETQNLVGRN